MPRLILTRALAAQAHDQLEHQVHGSSLREAFDAMLSGARNTASR